MFVGFQLWGTGVSQARSQQALRASLRADVPTVAGSGSRPTSGGTAAKGSSKAAPTMVLDGGAVSLIEIPKIGVTQAVVEGTTVDDLHKGPGHYTGSAMPGQIGNVAIAGHRTTYGAPFARLNELHANDVIYLTSKAGRYRYVVSKDPFVVLPTQREVVAPTPDAELTLTTCHPRYEASRRLIVNAHLAPDSATPAQAVAASPFPGVGPTVLKNAVSAADAQITQFDFFVLPMCIFWGLLMIYAWFAATRLAERWAKYSAWLLATPVLMFLLWEFFTAVNQFLPAYV
jgi:sortase A